MLKGIHSLLDRFKLIEPPEGVRKKAVMSAIEEVLDIRMTPEQIKIQGNTAYITGNSLLRSEIMLHKGDILRLLRNSFGELSRNPVTDIR